MNRARDRAGSGGVGRRGARGLIARARRAALWLALAFAPVGVGAQRAAPAPLPPVLFVCEHGTVRSLLAKLLFDEYAAAVGLARPAIARGTQPDSAVPPWMLAGLAGDRLALGHWHPQPLTARDLSGAALVVSFDVPSSATAGTTAPRAQWDSLPSVSRDYAAGRDAIKARVHRLVDSLKQAERRRAP
ncbi:MAG: hypothetical protein HY275_05320 [Gemmatimonadetes bacterium]|nr:hypothetical protein [Gemmatimonadota bacterium]